MIYEDILGFYLGNIMAWCLSTYLFNLTLNALVIFSLYFAFIAGYFSLKQYLEPSDVFRLWLHRILWVVHSCLGRKAIRATRKVRLWLACMFNQDQHWWHFVGFTIIILVSFSSRMQLKVVFFYLFYFKQNDM